MAVRIKKLEMAEMPVKVWYHNVEQEEENGRFRLDLTVPKGIPCRVCLPDGSRCEQKTVSASYECGLGQ